VDEDELVEELEDVEAVVEEEIVVVAEVVVDDAEEEVTGLVVLDELLVVDVVVDELLLVVNIVVDELLEVELLEDVLVAVVVGDVVAFTRVLAYSPLPNTVRTYLCPAVTF
jgi:hypothetical protein